jgi:hypothetical protein
MGGRQGGVKMVVIIHQVSSTWMLQAELSKQLLSHKDGSEGDRFRRGVLRGARGWLVVREKLINTTLDSKRREMHESRCN